MNERLGCLGTFAALVLCLAGWMIWKGDEMVKVGGFLLALPSGLFLAVRVACAKSRHDR